MSSIWKRGIAVGIAMLLAVPAATAAPKDRSGGGAGGGKKGGTPAPQTFTAPFSLVRSDGSCTPNTPAESCDVSFGAEASGAIQTSVAFEKVIPDLNSWHGIASGGVGAVYELGRSVAAVGIVIEVRVNSATVEQLGLGENAQRTDAAVVQATAFIEHTACLACLVQQRVTVLKSSPGTASVTDRTVAIAVEMTNPAGSVPPGSIESLAGITSMATLWDGPGRARSTSDATVTKIVVTPRV